MARTLAASLPTDGPELVEGSQLNLLRQTTVVDLIRNDHGITGVRVIDKDGVMGEIAAPAVILAAGGIGQAWETTTNPATATGDGIALALRAGAVVRDIERMEDMIGAVLAFIRDGAEASHRERLDLRSVIEVAADDAAAMGVDVPVTGEDRPIIVDGDPSALTRLFGNIVDNALKYGHGAEARVFQADDHGIVEVVDTGPGLPAGEMERVFEPFYRADPARTLTDDGVGLGLAVCEAIVSAHHGSIWVEAPADGGACFVIALPAAEPPPVEDAEPLA